MLGCRRSENCERASLNACLISGDLHVTHCTRDGYSFVTDCHMPESTAGYAMLKVTSYR